jgi:pimeloyl-ACP methyl ester carboxylesterase
MKRFAVLLVPFLMIFSATHAAALKTGYAPVNGLQLYYEIHGEAQSGRPPLVLLHGGGDTIQTSFGHVLPFLAANRQVIALEQQGYGHTADIKDRPFTFEQSADDTAAVLTHLKIEQADICGFSNGGTIALQLAIRHPSQVRRIISVSGLYSREGCAPEFWDSMKDPRVEMMPAELKAAYLEVAPHPENFESFFFKAAHRMRDFKDIPLETLRNITAPVLVINGDRDVILSEHAVKLSKLVSHGQLAILPATNHGEVMARTELIVPMITRFLDSE